MVSPDEWGSRSGTLRWVLGPETPTSPFHRGQPRAALGVGSVCRVPEKQAGPSRPDGFGLPGSPLRSPCVTLLFAEWGSPKLLEGMVQMKRWKWMIWYKLQNG